MAITRDQKQLHARSAPRGVVAVPSGPGAETPLIVKMEQSAASKPADIKARTARGRLRGLLARVLTAAVATILVLLNWPGEPEQPTHYWGGTPMPIRLVSGTAGLWCSLSGALSCRSPPTLTSSSDR